MCCMCAWECCLRCCGDRLALARVASATGPRSVETTCNVIGDTLSARTVTIWAGEEDQLIVGGSRGGEVDGKTEPDAAGFTQVQSPLSEW